MIKAVAQSIPTFTISCFKLPKFWCDDINSMVSKYWWGREKREKIHWVSWRKLVRKSWGGGGGWVLEIYINLIWPFSPNKGGGLHKIQAYYFIVFLMLVIFWMSNPSFVWRSIIRAKDLVEEARWKLGSRTRIKIWEEHWLSIPPVRRLGSEYVVWVSELIDQTDRCWDSPGVSNTLVWFETFSRRFTVQLVYEFVLQLEGRSNEGECSDAKGVESM